MSIQHSIQQQPLQDEQHPEDPKGIVIPLELAGLRLLSQRIQANGSIEVEVIGTNERAQCPRGPQSCVKVHDTRWRRKRDVSLRGYPVVLLLHKRRGRRAFTVVVLSPRQIVPVVAIDIPQCDCVNGLGSRQLVNRLPRWLWLSTWARADVAAMSGDRSRSPVGSARFEYG
jgi:hypothetical protein